MEQPNPPLMRCESELWDQVMLNFQLNTPLLESAPEPQKPRCKTEAKVRILKERKTKQQKPSRAPVDRIFEKNWITSALTACDGFAVSRDKIIERYVDDCWQHKHPPINTTVFLKMITSSFPNCQLQKFGSKKDAQLYLIGVQFTPANAQSNMGQKTPSEAPVGPCDVPTNTDQSQDLPAPPTAVSVLETAEPHPRQVPMEADLADETPVPDAAAIGKLAAECLLTNFNGQKNLVPDILWDLTRWTSALHLDQLLAHYPVTEGEVVDFLFCLRNHLLLVGAKVTGNGLDKLAAVLTEFWITCNNNVQIRRSVLHRLIELPPVVNYLATVYQQFYMNLLQFVAPSDRIYFASKKRSLIALLTVLDTWMIEAGKALPGKCGGVLVGTTYGFVHTTGILLHLNQNLQTIIKTNWNQVFSKTTRDLLEKHFTGICASSLGPLQTTAIAISEIIWKCMHDPPSRYHLFPSVVQTFADTCACDSVHQIRNMLNKFLSTIENLIPQCSAAEEPHIRAFLCALSLCVSYATDKASARVGQMSIVEYFAKAFIREVPAIGDQTAGKDNGVVDHYLRYFAYHIANVQP